MVAINRRRPPQFVQTCTFRSNARRINWAQVHPRRTASGSAVPCSPGMPVSRETSVALGAGVTAAGTPKATTAARTRALGASTL